MPSAAISAAPRRFIAVVGRSQTWKNLAYLALAFPLGLAYVIVLSVGLSVGAGLAIVFVGLPILCATLAAWRGMASLERTLARSLLGVRIPMPPQRESGLTAWTRVKLWLRDPVTWKSFVFVIAKLPMGIVALVVITVPGALALVLALAPVIAIWVPIVFFGWEIDGPLEALPLLPVGVLASVATLHLFNGLSWLYGLTARVMLGPSTVELHERVDDLRDSRARILAAADDERRRIERDLHDGAQQRLVSLTLTLGLAEGRFESDPDTARKLVHEAREEAQRAVQELRELARGIHPALLSERGLGPALDALAARAPVPVEVSGVPGRAAARRRRGGALLHDRRGADQHRQVRPRPPGHRHGRDRAGLRDPVRLRRRRRRRRSGRRQRPARPARPRGGARRPPRRGLPAGAGHHRHRRDPAGGPLTARRAVLLPVAVALAAVAAGCGSGPMTEQSRDMPDFERVRSEGSIDVVVRSGGRVGPNVVVRAGEKVIDDVGTEVVGDTLVVDTESRGLVIGPDGFENARVLVDVPRLRGAEVEGSSDIELAGLTGGALDVDVQGSGDVQARGRVDSLDAHVQGSGDADLGDLAAGRVAVGVEGSGDAEVHPVDELRAVVEGSGSISYSGNPRVTLSRTAGSDDIERD